MNLLYLRDRHTALYTYRLSLSLATIRLGCVIPPLFVSQNIQITFKNSEAYNYFLQKMHIKKIREACETKNLKLVV